MFVNFKKIQQARRRLGIGTSEAGRRAGWTPQKWANLEGGRSIDPRVSTMIAAAAVLGCPVDDLLMKPKRRGKK